MPKGMELASRGGHHRRGVGRQTARCYRLDRRITQQRETATGYDFYLVMNARQFEALQATVSWGFIFADKIIRQSEKKGKPLKRTQNTRYQLLKILEAIEDMKTTELHEWKEDKQLPLTKCATCSKRTHGLTQIETEN